MEEIKKEIEKAVLDGDFDSKHGSVKFDDKKIADWFTSRTIPKSEVERVCEEMKKKYITHNHTGGLREMELRVNEIMFSLFKEIKQQLLK